MPCMDYDARPGQMKSNVTNYKEEIERLKARNDQLAQMLCVVLSKWETDALVVGAVLPDDVLNWWTDHKEKDAARRAEEKNTLRANILRLVADSKMDILDVKSVMEDLLNE